MTLDWLYSQNGYLLPLGLSGGVVVFVWLFALALALYKTRQRQPRWGKSHVLGFVVLLLLTPISSAITIPALRHALPLPSPGAAQAVLTLLPFAALPWMLAAGFLGTTPAVVLAFISGLIIGEWSTRLPAEALIQATLALIVAWGMWQPYRTRAYRALRQPLVAAAVATLFYPLVFSVGMFAYAGANIAARADFVFNYALDFTLYTGSALLIAGIVGQAVALWQPRPWGYTGKYEPSPLERSLAYRFSVVVTILMVSILVGIAGSNWKLAQRSARGLIIKQMQATAHVTAQTIPFFADNGKTALQSIADNLHPDQYTPEELNQRLHDAANGSFLFSSLILVDEQGHTIASYPPQTPLSPDEEQHITFLAKTRAPIHYSTLFNPETQRTSIAFYARVDTAGEQPYFLVGHTYFDENPYTKPILSGLKDLKNIQGGGIILDSDRHILYSTDTSLNWLKDASLFSPSASLTATLTGDATTAPLPQKEGVYETTSPQSDHYLLYLQQARGTTWMILLVAPTSQLQAIALENALPLMVVVLVFAIIGIVLLRSLVNILTHSLRSLTAAAERIASGQLNHPLSTDSVDEVGQLRRAFEYMRQRLQARMSELSRLLHTSQQVAATLKVEEAANAVLAAAYNTEIAAIRIALSPEALPDDWHEDYPTRFGRGLASDAYASLDEQLLNYARKQTVLRFNHLNETSGLRLPTKPARPRALLAVALRYEARFLGVLYVVYNTPHTFSDEETRYINALGLQMAMAAYTARLYSMAEVRHQRLLAVLNASPDPILVTDNQDRLILANMAALTQLPVIHTMNQPLAEVIQNDTLLALLQSPQQLPYSQEVNINNRVYFATVTKVETNGAEVGRVCILRDVTHFKELDALKSEFVATVSHDLRAPLTLISGYLTMLEMVGQLNERQARYVSKIQSGVQNMTQLVNNLLDLGRIEAGVGLQLQLISILDTIDEVVKRWQPHAERKRITLQTDIDPKTPPLVEADPVLLDRVLHNLVDNAIKYTPSGGTVTVLARPVDDDKVLFGIKDSGVGISPIDQPRLFEKFFRIARRDAPKEKGTGLGLAIVKSIVERHHGRVWVESQLGEGSTFFVELPLRQPQTDQADTLILKE